MNLFQILASTSDFCSDFSLIFDIIKFVLNIIQFGVPIVLIILISVDLFKAMAGSGDEKQKKEVQDKSIRRLIYAVTIFLIPILIKMVLGFIPKIVSNVNTNEANNFWTCWNKK